MTSPSDPRFADPRLRDLDPVPDPLPAGIEDARSSLARSIAHLMSVPDAALERDWPWIGSGETDVRSGFYIAIERLQQARGKVLGALAKGRFAPTLTTGSISAATEARWDLHGLLAPLGDDQLDAAPGGEEWTLRETLRHVVGTQRAYCWFTAWWAGQAQDGELPYPPDALDDDLPPEALQASGSLGALRSRLDALVDLGSALWRSADEETLAKRARWSGFEVAVRFRIGRWGPHIEEHTVQVEKTLDMLGHLPTEVDRLIRLVHRSHGRLESLALAQPVGAADGAVSSVIASAASEVEELTASVATAARG